MTSRARTIFLGSGRFALPTLQALSESTAVDLLAVITAPPRPAGRRQQPAPSPVATWAEQHGMLTLTPVRLRAPESVASIRGLDPELLVLADYGQIVPSELLDLPSHGALNVHPSLLPRHRGATPVPAAILAGDHETGVTLIQMDPGLDTGPIVAQRRMPLRGDETAAELEDRLAREGAALLSESLAHWLDGSLAATPQPSDGATLTRPLRREDGRLDPNRSAEELSRQVRAYQGWPGSFLDTPFGRVVVWKAEPVVMPQDADGPSPGHLVHDGQGLGLVTADGLLRLLDVQPAGGRRMSGEEFARGRRTLLGSRVQSGTLR